MKNMRLISGVTVSAIIVSVLIFNSCSKQELADKPVTGKQEVKMSEQDIAVYNKIMSFKQKIEYIQEHPEYKSGETMSVDSAKWYLDASFNFTYSFINYRFTDYNTDTFTLVIPKSGEEINLEDLSTTFYEMKDKTLDIYQATQGDEKELYVSYLEITNNTSNEVTFSTTATIGSKSNEPPPGLNQWGPFEEGDDWMYGVYNNHLGDCSPGGGIWWGVTDAAEKLENFINYYRKKHDTIGPGLVAYYTEPSATAFVDVKDGMGVYSDLLINPNDVVVDNYRDFLALYQIKNEPELIVHTCIEWNELNFYYHGVTTILYEIIQEHPDIFGVHQSLSFVTCDIKGMGDNNSYDPDIAHHNITAIYKTRHILGGSYQPTSINE